MMPTLTLNKGVLIAIEGIDGSGKSTFAHNLYHTLKEYNFPTLLTKEPGGTSVGQQLRTIVQEKKTAVCPKAEYLLFAADRAQHFDEIILPAIQKKKLIISDRMNDSSSAYQGYGRGLNLDIINTVNRWAMNNQQPDLVIYLRIDPKQAVKRLEQRNEALTSFEKEKKQFITKVVRGFETIFAARDNVIYLDATQTAQQLTKTGKTAIITWLNNKKLLT